MTAQLPPPVINHALLLPVVRMATTCPHLHIDTWQTTTLSVQGQRSIYRFVGTGYEGSLEHPWSLILKVIRAPVHADMVDWDSRNWVYWEREYLLYKAGIPQTLSGDLRAPRCYGTLQPTPDQCWIWLEDLHDCYESNWPIERYGLAARHLRAFNGAYLVGKRIPRLLCLQGERLRSRSADAIANFERLRTPALWAHPRLRRVFPHSVLGDLEQLLADRERLLGVLTRLPQTFCHLDVHVGNMAARRDDSGAELTILFDWAIAGYAAPGQEIANLVWSSFLEFKLEVSQVAQLEAAVLDGYLQGLADVGWQGDPHVVRCAYLIASLLIFGLTPEAVDHAWNEADHAALERYYGWSIDTMIEQAAEVTHLLLARSHEVRKLLNALSL
jgi:Phosphotransferase enzyme family